MLAFSYLIEDAHGQHREGCVYDIVESDEVLVVDSLNERITVNKVKVMTLTLNM